MTNVFDQLLNFLNANQTDPLTYLVVFFLFSVAAAVFLPIPVEFGLIWNPGLYFPLKAIDLGLGKAVGSVGVFYIPSAIRSMGRWFGRRRVVRWSHRLLGSVARRTGMDRLRLYRWARRRIRLAEKPSAPAPPKWGWIRWLSRKSEGFTRRYGVLAMYLIMSIPGMLDTVPLYVFSILNKDRTLISLQNFALANFLAGINRAIIIFAVLDILGIRLF